MTTMDKYNFGANNVSPTLLYSIGFDTSDIDDIKSSRRRIKVSKKVGSSNKNTAYKLAKAKDVQRSKK